MDGSALRKLVAANVRRLVNDRDWTITHLAALAGVSRASLVHALNGANSMTLDRLARLADALEVHPSELLARREVVARVAQPRGQASARRR